MSNMVLGVFSTRVEAEDAIVSLQDAGFRPQDISVVVQSQDDATAIQDNTGANVAEAAASGAATGAVVGGLAGLLVGIGAIAVPGVGALLIGGPLAAALGLTGTAAATVSGATTGALAGGLIGALTGLGLSEDDARMYEERVTSGGVLVAVPAGNMERGDASAILAESGAEQIRTINTDR